MDMFTTMITPFTEDGKVDYATAERYVDWYYDNGLTGIFATCQSSEIFFLTLEERVELNRRVYARAQYLKQRDNRPFTIVSSGHVSDTIEGQAEELNAIWKSGTDALILITNRLDINNEGDDVFIANAERLLSMLPDDVKLGFYECPYPYKRLLSPKILDWALSTGKFYYMKDTCCDVETIKARCEQLKGTQFKLLNANAQTLLETMQHGCEGYCGVMANYHPKLYAWLGENYAKEPEKAALLQSVLGSLAFTEFGVAYPLSAKYHMNLCGIPTANVGRNRPASDLTDYGRDCMRQMKALTDYVEKQLEA